MPPGLVFPAFLSGEILSCPQQRFLTPITTRGGPPQRRDGDHVFKNMGILHKLHLIEHSKLQLQYSSILLDDGRSEGGVVPAPT